MTKQTLLVSLLATAFTSAAFAGPFSPGNIVVVRMGDGAAALSSAGTAVFLDEFTTGGTLVQSVAMPTSVSGSNRSFVNAGTATSEGFMSRSTDGQFLILGGYDTAVGTAAVAGTASASVARVAGRVSFNGTIDTSTGLGDAYSGGNVRSVVSLDGTSFWLAGSNQGTRYATFGATTSIQLNTTAPTNVRVINTQNGQLYVSSASGTTFGVLTVGTGMPTTAGQTLTLLPGMPTTAGPSSYDYWFANASTLYLADDRATASGGGLQKWIFDGSNWSLQYTLNSGLTAGLRGLTGSLNGNSATFFASSSDAGANKLVLGTDDITNITASGSFTTIATAATNTAFRGVEFTPTAPVPEPASLAILGVGALAILRRRRSH